MTPLTTSILDLTDIRRRQRAKLSQARGKQGQLLAENRLRALGFELVEGVTTPTASKNKRTIYIKKVSGDIRAVLPPFGISVLAEVKTRPDSLSLSDFYGHQLDSLCAHQIHGGLSLIVWVKVNKGLSVMRYCDVILHMRKGEPLDWEQALGLGIKNKITERVTA